jgi:hypothetical protein
MYTYTYIHIKSKTDLTPPIKRLEGLQIGEWGKTRANISEHTHTHTVVRFWGAIHDTRVVSKLLSHGPDDLCVCVCVCVYMWVYVYNTKHIPSQLHHSTLHYTTLYFTCMCTLFTFSAAFPTALSVSPTKKNYAHVRVSVCVCVCVRVYVSG